MARPMSRHAVVVSAALALVAGACKQTAPAPPPERPDTAPPPSPDGPALEPFCPRRLSDPPRLVLERPCGTERAVLTDGAYTAVLVGPLRRLGGTASTAVV